MNFKMVSHEFSNYGQMFMFMPRWK